MCHLTSLAATLMHGTVLLRKVTQSTWSFWIFKGLRHGFSSSLTLQVAVLWHSGSFIFPVSWLSLRPYIKSRFWRPFIRMDGGVLWCSLREYIRATSFPAVYKWLPPKCKLLHRAFSWWQCTLSEDHIWRWLCWVSGWPLVCHLLVQLVEGHAKVWKV